MRIRRWACRARVPSPAIRLRGPAGVLRQGTQPANPGADVSALQRTAPNSRSRYSHCLPTTGLRRPNPCASHSTTDLAWGATTPCWTGKGALFAVVTRTRSLAKVVIFCCRYRRRFPFSLFTFGRFPQPEVRHDPFILHKGVLLRK